MRKSILLFFSSFWSILCFSQTEPNIIFIFCDDLNVAGSALGGHFQAKIPNIESLMTEGVTFTNCQSNAPICGPSRASIFSGLYPHSTGNFGFEMHNNEWDNNPVIQGADQIFEHFKDNGYEVYAGGKTYHAGTEDLTMFDEYGVPPSHGPYPWDGQTIAWGKPQGVGHNSMPANLQEQLDGIAPLSDVPTVNGHTGWIDNGKDYRFVDESNRGLMTDEKLAIYADSILHSSHADPFFLTLGIQRPHTPLYVPEQYFDMYPLDSIAIPGWMEDDLLDVASSVTNNTWAGKTGLTKYKKRMESSADSADEKYWVKRYIQGYLASVTFVDDQLGKVLASLDSSAYKNDTYIVLSSDHGFHLGQKDWIFKWSLWDAGTHVPFIVTGPGVAQGAQVEQPISLIDVYPSFVDLADIPQPTQSLDGYSIKALIEDPVAGAWLGPDVALTSIASDEKITQNSIADKDNQHYAVRSEDYRYILSSAGEEELYDHTIDSNEYFNLAHDPSYETIKEDLKSQMLAITGHTPLESLDPDTSIFQYGGFEQELNGWQIDLNNGTVGEVTFVTNDVIEGTYALQADITSRETGDNSVQIINENYGLELGVQYELSFWAKAGTDGSLMSTHSGRNGTPNYNYLHNSNYTITDEWAKYTHVFTHTDPSSKLNSRFYFRLLSEDIYWIDDVKIRNTAITVAPASPICDRGFEGDASEWELAFQDGGAGSGGVQSIDVHNELQSYQATITTDGANEWSNKLMSCLHSLENGKTYELKFWAKASADGMMIGAQHGLWVTPYTNYLDQAQALTTSWEQYSYTFTAGSDAVNTARVKIQLRDEGDYYFDDFSLFDPTLGVNDNIDFGIEVFPNPAKDIVRVKNNDGIDYGLKLYSPSAQVMAEGSANHWSVGEIDLSGIPSGIYFLEVRSATRATTRKIIVE